MLSIALHSPKPGAQTVPNPPPNETPAEMRQRAQVLRENARLLRDEAAKCFFTACQLEREASQAELPTT